MCENRYDELYWKSLEKNAEETLIDIRELIDRWLSEFHVFAWLGMLLIFHFRKTSRRCWTLYCIK